MYWKNYNQTSLTLFLIDRKTSFWVEFQQIQERVVEGKKKKETEESCHKRVEGGKTDRGELSGKERDKAELPWERSKDKQKQKEKREEVTRGKTVRE